jgi:hypothetical protein
MSVNSRVNMQKDQECANHNARMSAVAAALQGKYGLIRTHDSLALIHILTADCLLNPGAKRLTAFDIHITAIVYGATARPGQFAVAHTYRNFIAYDLVALFSSPSSFAHGASTTSTSIIAPPAHWIAALKALETRANEPGRGGHEALTSIFADDTAINTLVRSSMQMSPVSGPGFAQRVSCTPRDASFAFMHPMDRRLSSH